MSWKATALALARAFERMAQLESEARNELTRERYIKSAELAEARAETEDARARCAELEKELETAREARDILLTERKNYRDRLIAIGDDYVSNISTAGKQ